MLLVVAALASGLLRQGQSASAKQPFGLNELPLELNGYRGRALEPSKSVFGYLNPDEMIERIYVDPDEAYVVKLSIVFARGWRALHSPRACYKNQGWAVIEDSTLAIALGNGSERSARATRLVMTRSGVRIVAVYVFVTGQATTGNWLLHSMRMALSGETHGGALIVGVTASSSPASDAEATEAVARLVLEATRFMQGKWTRAG